ncbi:MAG: HesA/MoeB/ThiF family protein [Succinivibrio sp.]
MELTSLQQNRYSRHITLKEFGPEGQKKLLSSKVLVIGTGGLGSPALMYLAAAGIGTIGIVDEDVVDYSNLQRQVIHTTADVGTKKTESAKKTINELNPDVNVIIHDTHVNADNIMEIISGYDFILDCTDNFESKFLINDACVLAHKAFCHGAVIRFNGQVMTYVPGRGPCYRCIFTKVPKQGTVPNSKQIGVFGPLPGIIGNFQVIECVKYLLGIGSLLIGRLLTVDALDMKVKVMKLPSASSECAVCSDHPSIKDIHDSF